MKCHHLSAHSFEQVVRRAKARFVAGLSATVTRKDGHHPIVFMQCGAVRHRVDARAQAAARPFEHTVLVRPTAFHPESGTSADKRMQFQALYQFLVDDDARNRAICDEVVQAVRDGRSPLILTERNEHLDRFEGVLSASVPHVVVLRGGMGKKQRRAAAERLSSYPTGRRSRHPGDWQIHRRGIRRSAIGHAVSDASGLSTTLRVENAGRS